MALTIEALLDELGAREPIGNLWRRLGCTRAELQLFLIEHYDVLLSEGVRLHAATVSQASRPALFVEVGGKRYAAISLDLNEDAQPGGALVPVEAPSLASAAAAADRAAAVGLFQDYRSRRAANSRRAHDADLDRWASYLRAAGVALDCADWAITPECWRGVSWGLVAGFVQWQLDQGYAVASVNRVLSTVKVYARLAAQAGTLDRAELAMIRTVAPYTRNEGRKVDQARPVTRVGRKKGEHTPVTPAHARALKRQPDTPQGRRDALLFCLLLDHGLRVGELAGLQVTAIDLAAGKLRFYRPKVGKEQTHTLTAGTLRAARAYLDQDALAAGPLFRASRKDGTLDAPGLTARAINERVRVLGEAVGIEGLSPHDCRHFWATQAAKHGTPLDRLQDAGGWASVSMPLRYVEQARISNSGVQLGNEEEDDE